MSTDAATATPTATPAASETTAVMPIAKALNAGLRAAMSASDRVLLMGEDIGRLGASSA